MKPPTSLNEMTPKEIVEALDRHIVGQDKAKRAVAVAIRNRWRRRQLPAALARDVVPRNILMIGPTGVGKTEIARRLATLVGAPMVKVEASKFTEVGYVGRDVESMVRDLMEAGIKLVEGDERQRTHGVAQQKAEENLVAALVEHAVHSRTEALLGDVVLSDAPNPLERERLAAGLRQRLQKGELEDQYVPLSLRERRKGPDFSGMIDLGMGDLGQQFNKMMERMVPRGAPSRRTVRVRDARALLVEQETESLLDRDKVVALAKDRVEQQGIIFVDELDKIATREDQEYGSGPQVSRQGVQRDMLPIVEGCVVNTKHGPVDTRHILFIAAGAFHITTPADLIPELQGRFSIRVELHPLSKSDFVRILTEPENALIKQYQALMETEGVRLEFTEDGVEEIARMAADVNDRYQDIGARRLYTIMERLLEEVAFKAPEIGAQTLTFDREAVFLTLAGIIDDDDLSRYVL